MGISHRSNQHNQIQIRKFLSQLLLKVIRGIFINIKYYKPFGLMCGYLDSEEALPEFLEKLEQAGIQEILQAKQSALDNWLNASH